MGHEAVARHHVEADAGQEHDLSRFRFGVPRGEGLENINFAGDVEVVNTVAETGIRYRARRRRKRTGDIEHHRNAFDRSIHPSAIAEIKRSRVEAERPCDRIDFCVIM